MFDSSIYEGAELKKLVTDIAVTFSSHPFIELISSKMGSIENQNLIIILIASSRE